MGVMYYDDLVLVQSRVLISYVMPYQYIHVRFLPVWTTCKAVPALQQNLTMRVPHTWEILRTTTWHTCHIGLNLTLVK